MTIANGACALITAYWFFKSKIEAGTILSLIEKLQKTSETILKNNELLITEKYQLEEALDKSYEEIDRLKDKLGYTRKLVK